MKAVVQRVKKAKVEIDNIEKASINQGFLIFLGVDASDTDEDAKKLAYKIANLRIFTSEDGKMNKNLMQVNGEVLSVSQFTLLANVKKGHRPNFNQAKAPKEAKELYEKFNEYLSAELGKEVKTGEFGSDMQIDLVNDGPVTILYDTKEL